jgi:NAD(P)-dependent dehydrogenase (short-subunit alcohol dehydrogenase family)
VINNAGILSTTVLPDADVTELQRILSVDPCGHFNVCRAAWPHMVEQHYGRVVICASAAAFGGGGGLPYGIGKAASFGLSRALAALGLSQGIQVNALAPFAFTRMSDGLPQAQVALRQRLPPPDLVSAAALFLAHESCTLSGECIAAGAGRVSRVFLAESDGYYDPDISPDSIERS